ncbi:MAG TPA: hypothetical protein VFI82_04950 [Terriglobales bacterium]|nr:hypothetical protein [Terriglobales bacterium]
MAQQPFKIGIVDNHFPRRLAFGTRLDRAFVKSLEKAHLGNGVLFGTGERAAVLCGPAVEGRLLDENFERKGRLAVNRNDISELAARAGITLSATPIEKIILIHETISGGVAFDTANGIGASHGGIIGGERREVNARVGEPKVVPK